MRTLLFAAVGVIILLLQVAYAEVQWRAKPIQCGPMDTLMERINQSGEEALLGAMTRVTIENEMYDLPLVLFLNSETKEFTVAEFHLQDKEACVIAWGGAVDFEIYKFFEEQFPKKNIKKM
jgi:hypothetical protein